MCKQYSYIVVFVVCLPDFLSTTEMKYLEGSIPLWSPGHNTTLFSDRRNLKPSSERCEIVSNHPS